jgi:chromosome segregation ATPase
MTLREIESLAAQHEVISDKIKKEICPTIAHKSQEFRTNRKRHLNDLHALNNAYQSQIDNMQRNLKGYMKAFKDAESAHIKFYKADHNMDLSRAEVEKCRQNLQQKVYTCEQAKQHYAAALETTNAAQRHHYTEKIPHLLDEMRRLDIERIHETKQAMMQCLDVETGVLNIVQRCYNDMKAAISTIDPPKDTHVVVEQNKTGYPVPPDFEFKDLGIKNLIIKIITF